MGAPKLDRQKLTPCDSDWERQVHMSCLPIYISIAFSTFAILAIVVIVPLLTHGLTTLEVEVRENVSAVREITDVAWTDLMKLRKDVPTNRILRAAAYGQRVRKRQAGYGASSTTTSPPYPSGDETQQPYGGEGATPGLPSGSDELHSGEFEFGDKTTFGPDGFSTPSGIGGTTSFTEGPSSTGTPNGPDSTSGGTTPGSGTTVGSDMPTLPPFEDIPPNPDCPPGPPGPPGEAGTDGMDGPDGKDGEDGEDNVYEPIYAPCMPCPRGPPGPPGPKGETGPLGHDGCGAFPGRHGFPGEMGKPGPKGVPGTPGNDGVPGVAGPPGADTRTGAGLPGPKGPSGQPGPQGPAGPCGNHGKPGPYGDEGTAGGDGLPGDDGDDGQPGNPGMKGFVGKDAQYCACPERVPSVEPELALPTGDDGYQSGPSPPAPTPPVNDSAPIGYETPVEVAEPIGTDAYAPVELIDSAAPY